MGKYIELDVLPKTNSNKIDWSKSMGFKVKFTYGDLKDEMKILDYTQGKNPNVKVKYNNTEHIISYSSFKKCSLGRMLGSYTGDFRIEIGEVLVGKYGSLTILDREYRIRKNKKGDIKEKWYKCKCSECGWEEYWVGEGHLLKHRGCACCSGKVVVPGINDIATTNPELVKFFKNKEDVIKYTKGSNKEVTVKCINCGSEKEMCVCKIYEYKSITCTCGDGFSYPEKFINSLLNQLNVEFTQEYSPDYLIPKEGRRYRKYSDFYLPNHKIAIEADGGLGHKGGMQHSKSNRTLEESIAIDKWKDEQHLNNGVKTIRIDSLKSEMEYIKNNILNSELGNMFDLSKIDWLKCEEFALSNMIKEVCDYWKNKEYRETTSNLAIKFGIDVSTILDYLHKGNKLGWCNYDSTKEKSIVSSRNGKLFSKKVEVFKEGVSLGVFESASDLSKKSVDELGVYFCTSTISNVCKGKQNTSKGYSFKFTKEEC